MFPKTPGKIKIKGSKVGKYTLLPLILPCKRKVFVKI